MHVHLTRRAFACLFGSLLLGVTAAYAQQFPFPYQSVTYSVTLDNPFGGDATGFGTSVGVDGLTVLVGIPYYGPTDSYGFPTGQGRVAVFTADAATGEVLDAHRLDRESKPGVEWPIRTGTGHATRPGRRGGTL